MQNPALIKKIQELNLRLSSCKDYQQVVDAATSFLGNPLVVYDIAYITWAYTRGVITDDPLWNELTTTGTFSPETVAFIQKQFVEAYTKSSVVAFMKSSLKYNRLNGGVFNRDGVQVANVLMLELNRPFEQDDYQLINEVCRRIAKIIEQSGKDSPSRMYGETLIGGLLEGKPYKHLYRQELKELQEGLKEVVYIAVVDIMQFDPTLTHIVYFSEYFKKICADFKYFVHLNNIVIIISFSQIVLSIERELRAFDTFFKRFNIYAGVSGHFSNLLDIKKYFKQAVNALNYGQIMGGNSNIFSFDTFRIELFLKPHLDKVNILELCHPLVFSIAQYDKSNNTRYVALFYAYLLNGRDIKLAARDLGVSPAEFNVLLKRASKLFDIDWKNGSLSFTLMRSIRLLKCFPERFGSLPFA